MQGILRGAGGTAGRAGSGREHNKMRARGPRTEGRVRWNVCPRWHTFHRTAQATKINHKQGWARAEGVEVLSLTLPGELLD